MRSTRSKQRAPGSAALAMEQETEERPILELKGPHGRFSLQALPMGDDNAAAYAVVSAESGGLYGSSSFHLASASLASFVRDSGCLRRGEDAQAAVRASSIPGLQSGCDSGSTLSELSRPTCRSRHGLGCMLANKLTKSRREKIHSAQQRRCTPESKS